MPRLRIQGWDPSLLLSQIVLLQALHYLTLSLLLPPLLSLLTDPAYLDYLGGPGTVGMLLDWRQMAGSKDVVGASWGAWDGGGAAGRKALEWARVPDPRRGWVLGAAWLLASCIDISYLYYIIRRPTHILDFSATMLFNHAILTSYYSSSIPLSIFWWIIMIAGVAVMVVFAEQLCVRRELREGIGSSDWAATAAEDEEAERIEMGGVSID